jgi:hypothetical protein
VLQYFQLGDGDYDVVEESQQFPLYDFLTRVELIDLDTMTEGFLFWRN